MEINFEPSVCREKTVDGQLVNNTFEGHIRLKVPTFDERYQFTEDCGMVVADDGGIERKASNFTIMRNMVKLSQKFYVSVEMKKLADGSVYTSFDELSADPDCDGILLEVAREVRSGFRPGKN